MGRPPIDPASLTTRPVTHSSNGRTIARLRLLVASGPERGRRCEPSESELSVGTAPGNDLVLSDPAVSRHHFAISFGARGPRIRDLGSTNGTRVDGTEVFDAGLREGATIEVGGTTLTVEDAGSNTEPLSTERSFASLLGSSSAMRRMFAMLPKIAASDATVLLTGETGTGKSKIARAIHDASARRDGPFVVVDCGAIPPSLIESELFGHVKGSFTGAHRDRLGAFRSAARGTLLLEEIGELPFDLQPKLLRALEERVVTPVGDDHEHPLDIRVLAATHRDLRERVNAERFRSDLYYRLHVVSLVVPPLRDRPSDIPGLVAHFYRDLTGRSAPKSLVAAFGARAWPGNVRELRAAVERAVILGEVSDPVETFEEIAETPGPANVTIPSARSGDTTQSFREAKERAVSRWESDYLRGLLAAHHGNVSSAARGARMDRNHLRDLLKRYGIDPRS